MAHYSRGLTETLAPADRTAVQELRTAILPILPLGRATIQNWTVSLGVIVRTPQRRLDTERTTFRELLNRVRVQLSAKYLGNPHMRITHVDELLAYSSIAAFTR